MPLMLLFWVFSQTLYTSSPPYLSILREDEKGIEILWQNNSQVESLKDYRYPPIIAGGRKVSNFPLPGVEFLVGIPQKGEISLNAVGEEISFIKGGLEFDVDGNPILSSPPFLKVERLAEIAGIEILRDVRFARIRLFPVEFNPGEGFKVYNKIKLNIFYAQPPEIILKEDYFDDIYESVFLNGEKAKFYKLTPAVGGNRQSFFQTSLNWVKIKIDSTGVYKINSQDLKRIGLNPNIIEPKTLRIYTTGKFVPDSFYPDTMVEIPIYVKGEEDGRFDEGDFILFYGERTPGVYTNFSYYWLTFGLKEGRRMKSYFGSPLPQTAFLSIAEDSLHWEVDLLCPARSGLLWAWEYMSKGSNEEKEFIKRLVLPQARTLKEIKVAFFGKSDSLRLRVFLNENLIDSVIDQRQTPPSTSIFQKRLNLAISETTEIKFSLYGSNPQELYLDYIAVNYEKDLTKDKEVHSFPFLIRERGNYNILLTCVKNPSHLFEIIPDTTTGVSEVRSIEGFHLSGETLIFGKTFFTPSQFILVNELGIRRPLSLEMHHPYRLKGSGFFDYIVIAPDEFKKTAQLLCQYRENNISERPNAKTLLATLSEIYDEYSFGREEPFAIKKFLREKRPYYCVLIGDATYDYRGILPYKKYPGVPTYEYGYDFSPNPYTDRAYACDAWYADLEGEGWSPDLILSRIPVRNENELRVAIKKIKDFERKREPYRNRFLLAGDDEFNGYYDRPDNIRFGTHIGQCEGISALLGDEFEPVKIYLTEYPYPLPNDKPEARRVLISALNQGVGMMAYFGHGWTGWLTHEKLLDIPSLTQLKNTDRPFFGFFGSCGVGKFDETESECLAEELVRSSSGAIATVGGSKATSSSSNYYFAQSLFSPLIYNPKATIGKGFLIAWPLDRKYHLFGDGAVFIPRVSGILPLSVEPETLKPGRLITVRTDSGRIGEGYYEITSYSPRFLRYYRSHLGSLTYTLPGEIFFLGRGKISGNQFNANFLFPKLPYPEVRYVENGSYTLLPNSARIRISALGKDTGIIYIARSLPFVDEMVISSDTSGPELTLFYKNKEIKEEMVVEKEFSLEGRIYDESGISILPSKPLGFYKNCPSEFCDLRGKLQFDFSSYQKASFSYQLKIADPCSLVFILYDNLGNETKKSYRFYLVRESLVIENNLYTQTGASGYFTFDLSLPSYITIKIYTISGRFLRAIETLGKLGFNRVYFDGRDREGKRLPKGIYLYQISASTLGNKKAVVFDKLLLP